MSARSTPGGAWSKAPWWSAALRLPGFRLEESRLSEQAMAALRAVGLDAVAEAPAGSLTLGHQRRLEIARALNRPRRATYVGTKAHLVAFTRALATELEGTGVQVQVCCPGRVATEFHQTNGAGPASRQEMGADEVAAASMAAVADGEVVCVPGGSGSGALAELVAAEGRVRMAGGVV